MLNPYLRKVDTSSLSNRIDLRVKYTDTSSMLSSYFRKIDTSNYVKRFANPVAIGKDAAITGQLTDAIAIGNSAGNGSQAQYAIAIGKSAGYTSQSQNTIALGQESGFTGQGAFAIALGRSAGYDSQGQSAIALGRSAGNSFQAAGAIAIGDSAGQVNQGANSIAIGKKAGKNAQTAGSIILNASGTELNAAGAGLFVKPIRSGSNSSGIKHLYYDESTGEIKYSTVAISGIAYNEIKSNSIYTGTLAMTSDRRLKTNIVGLSNSLDVINKLNPVSYKKKDNLVSNEYNHEEMGFIAQEIQKVLPMVVKESADKDKILSVNYISLIPVLTKAIQEQQKIILEKAKEIDQQKKVNDSQQKQIDELKKLVEELIKKK
jgi:hypothetical protein